MRPPAFFYQSQRDFILDDSPLVIAEKGRQLGISIAQAYRLVRRCSLAGARDEWVMSRDERQAKQFILYVKRWATILKIAADDMGEMVLDTHEGKQILKHSVRFASGACVYALSSSPDAIAGKTGHVTLDEFALHKDQRELYTVAKAVTQWGGTLTIISTHRGIGSVFNQIVRNIKDSRRTEIQRLGLLRDDQDSRQAQFSRSWSLHTISVQTAVDQGLVEKINKSSGRDETREGWLARQRAECIDEEQWLQEYCCIPADEASAFLSYDLIQSCEDSDCIKEPGYLQDCKNPLYVGVDVARKQDLFVIDVGEKVGDVIWDRLRVELKGKKFAELTSELNRILCLPQVKRCCIDASGMGMQMAEEAQQRFGYKVEGVTFTAPVKEELAFGLRAAFEDKRIRIPRDDKLSADLRGIKKEVTVSGNIRFAGESADSHCDRFWAKALRHHAAVTVNEVFAVVC